MRMRRGWELRAKVAIAIIVLSALAGAGVAQTPVEKAGEHPLERTDRSSPRATLESFLSSLNRAWDLYEKNDPRFQEYARAAKRCLDVSRLPPTVAETVQADSALVLKEVLDRIELPPLSRVPGPDEVKAGGLRRWTIPYTEIEIVLIGEGQREGEWLFSADTVERAREFYEKVRRLPYQPGKTGVHYDELRFGSKSRLVAGIVAKLPPWAKREYVGQLGWQWAVLALLLLLSIVMVALSSMLGRRMVRTDSTFVSVIGSALTPLVMISLQWVIPPLAPWHVQLGGPGVRLIGVVFTIVAYLGGAWLVAILFNHAARLVIHLTGADERPLHQQLILVVSKIASVMTIVFVLFKGGQTLGIPVSALVTGLGVGGLAVALSAQSTLENLIGGINLFADRPVRIGDFCKFGDELGVVEAIGLRSTRVRTLSRTVVSIPNSSFAKMQLENLSRRDRNLLRTKLRLDLDTSPDDIERLLVDLREMLEADERVAEEPFRVRLLDLGRDALEVEIYLYVLTDDWNEYLEIREELLLGAMRVVEAAGLRLALPTERHEVVRESPASPSED